METRLAYALKIVSGEVTSAKENALSEAARAPMIEAMWVLVLVMICLRGFGVCV